MKKWFVTWNRPEYKEWAVKIPQGYLLVILRKENDRFLCVKAKLIMGKTGLPAFEITEEQHFTSRIKALMQIQEWRQ